MDIGGHSITLQKVKGYELDVRKLFQCVIDFLTAAITNYSHQSQFIFLQCTQKSMYITDILKKYLRSL